MQINLKNMSELQRDNLGAALAAYRNQNVVSSLKPAVVFIELTQNCIARCSFCKSRGTYNPDYDMNETVFSRLLQEYIPSAVLVDLNGCGESLMLPKVDEYIERIAAYGPQIRFTTTLGCGSRKVLDSLIEHNVYLSVSLDAAEGALYEGIRKGVQFATVIKNLEYVAGEMKKKGTLNDTMRLSIAPLQGKNLEQIEKIINLAHHLGIKEIALDPLNAWPVHVQLLVYHKKRTLQALARASVYARERGIRLQLISAPFKELCIKEHGFDLCCHPWLYFFSNYRGEAFFCDHMVHPVYAKYSLGMILENKSEVWNGAAARNFRKAHLKRSGNLFAKCFSCYRGGRYADHEHAIDSDFARWLVTDKELEAHITKI